MLGWDDIFGGLRLVVASFIVLPLLPNRSVDPWPALDPRELWLLVVLISALPAVGYVATRWLGPGRGAVITGLAGGLVSSTAAILAFSRRSGETSDVSVAHSVVGGRRRCGDRPQAVDDVRAQLELDQCHDAAAMSS